MEFDDGEGFNIAISDFVEMFDGESHSNGTGLEKLKSLEGTTGVLRALKTSEAKGMSTSDPNLTQRRMGTYGTNAPKPVKIKTLWELIKEQLGDQTLKILMIACVASLSVGIWQDVEHYVDVGELKYEFVEGISILVSILICVIVGSWNNYAKEKQFQKLMSVRDEREVVVIRDGVDTAISVHSLLVGDILRINAGDQLPADCVLLSGTKMFADESSQTGETKDIEKEALKPGFMGKVNPFLISGTMIKEGRGVALVVCVGANTRMGRIREMMEEEEELTPLQRKLESIANGIGVVGMVAAIGTAIFMLIWLIIEILQRNSIEFKKEDLKRALNVVVYGITILVMAVPEGLPLAVTLSLAYSVSKMKDENNLVRQLDSCETMGGSNNICSDKTGTLTRNVMTVMGLFCEGTSVERNSNASSASISATTKKLLCEGICRNSSATVILDNNTKMKKRLGNATECALLDMAEAMGYRYDNYRNPEKELMMLPFNSKRKRMTTIYSTDNPSEHIVYVKGAPDILLPFCARIISKDGNVIDLDESSRRDIDRKVLLRNAEIGYRSLLLACKTVDASTFDVANYTDEDSYEELEGKLTIIAIVGIEDPLRDGVEKAVKTCQMAGITVRMVTGDNIDYAKSIAIQSGIITREQLDPDNMNYLKYGCMLGKDFYSEVGGLIKVESDDADEKAKDKIRNPEKFALITSQLRVLARSQPEHKYALVTGLKEDERNVVAVTGDGTNDAPALKKADIGFAMGITGTEIAKEASKIILLDDNFASIVTALKWGRNIYLSIRRFLQFQLTVNIAALSVAIITGVIGGLFNFKEPPINAIQMLWINLIMDTFAALALATEPPSPELLKGKPYGKNESILSPCMWRNIICVSIYEVAVLVTIMIAKPGFLVEPQRSSETTDELFMKRVCTTIFNTFVLMQIFNELSCRRFKSDELYIFDNFFNNWRFITIMIITIAVQVGIIESGETSFGVHAFGITKIDLLNQAMCLLIAANVVTWAILCKFLVPESLFSCIKPAEKVMTDQEILSGRVSYLRKSRRLTLSRKDSVSIRGLKSYACEKEVLRVSRRVPRSSRLSKKSATTDEKIREPLLD